MHRIWRKQTPICTRKGLSQRRDTIPPRFAKYYSRVRWASRKHMKKGWIACSVHKRLYCFREVCLLGIPLVFLVHAFVFLEWQMLWGCIFRSLLSCDIFLVPSCWMGNNLAGDHCGWSHWASSSNASIRTWLVRSTPWYFVACSFPLCLFILSMSWIQLLSVSWQSHRTLFQERDPRKWLWFDLRLCCMICLGEGVRRSIWMSLRIFCIVSQTRISKNKYLISDGESWTAWEFKSPTWQSLPCLFASIVGISLQ